MSVNTMMIVIQYVFTGLHMLLLLLLFLDCCDFLEMLTLLRRITVSADNITVHALHRRFLQDFQVVLKQTLQNYLKILMKWFLDTYKSKWNDYFYFLVILKRNLREMFRQYHTHSYIFSRLIIQSHNSGLSVAKDLVKSVVSKFTSRYMNNLINWSLVACDVVTRINTESIHPSIHLATLPSIYFHMVYTFNPNATDNTLVCDWRFESVYNITVCVV